MMSNINWYLNIFMSMESTKCYVSTVVCLQKDLYKQIGAKYESPGMWIYKCLMKEKRWQYYLAWDNGTMTYIVLTLEKKQ